MLTYFHPPLGRIGIIGWAIECVCRTSWPANDNDFATAARAAWLAEISPQPSPVGESASVSAFPTRHLGLAHGQHMDTVMPGHFCGEGRP